MDRKDWPVHEAHCCPKHGCKYGDSDCPVVLRETYKHKKHCEWCELEYEDPEPIDLLMAWANAYSDYVDFGNDNRGAIPIYNLEEMASRIKRNKCEIVNLGKKEGWWRKEE